MIKDSAGVAPHSPLARLTGWYGALNAKHLVTFLNTLAEYTMTVVPDGYTRESNPQIGTGPFILEKRERMRA